MRALARERLRVFFYECVSMPVVLNGLDAR